MINSYQFAKKIRMNPESNRNSMQATVNRLKRWLCSAKLPESYFHHISPILDIFPDASADTFLLEYNLKQEHGLPDFSVCFWNNRPVVSVFAGQDPYVRIPAYLYTHIVWQRLRDFGIHLQNNAADFTNMSNFWLEFDIAPEMPELPVPSFFMRINTDQYQDWFVDGMEIIRGKAISGPVKRQLQKLFALLPDNARVSQIGSFQARNWESVRLYIKMADHRQIIRFLNQMGYPGGLPPITAFWDCFSHWAGYVKLQMDIGPELLPKIAFEFLNDPANESWPSFIDQLCDHQLCAGANRDLLLNWTDSVFVQEAGQNDYLLLYKYISHIKVIYEPGAPLSAKAYLGVTYS
jgi:hypothetical protein